MAQDELKLVPQDLLFELPSLVNPSKYIQFGRDGKIGIRNKTSVLDSPKSMSADDMAKYPPAVYTLPIKIGAKSGISLPFGLTPLTGETRAGKSDFAKQLKSVIATDRVVAVEPADAYDLDNTAIYDSMDAAIVHLVRSNLAARLAGSAGPLMILDSLREGLFEISGPAGAKGIVNAFFTSTTRLSNALAVNGFTMVAIVNPMNLEPDYLKEFMSKLSSAIPAYIKLMGRRNEGNVVEFTGVMAARPTRDEKAFSFRSNQPALDSATELVEFVAKHADYIPDLFTGVAANILTETKEEGAV